MWLDQKWRRPYLRKILISFSDPEGMVQRSMI
jgi:hypothetical protein